MKTVILFGGGCFNPPSIMHTRMFDIAKWTVENYKHQPHKVLGGIISPCHDKYDKPGLLPSHHRLKMVSEAIKPHPWIKLSSWEVEQQGWTRTKLTLDEHMKQIQDFVVNDKPKPNWLMDSLTMEDLKNVSIYFICGDDLLESFNTPGIWLPEDIKSIVKDYGLIVLSRGGTNAQEMVFKSDSLHNYSQNIYYALSDMGNDISSTKIRLAVRRGAPIRSLVHPDVLKYIEENKLYRPIFTKGCSDKLFATEPYYIPRFVGISQVQHKQQSKLFDRNNPLHSPALQSKGSQCDLSAHESKDSTLNTSFSSKHSLIPMIDSEECDLLLELSIENEDMTQSYEAVRFRHCTSEDHRKSKKGPTRTKSENSLEGLLLNSGSLTLQNGKESFL